MNAKEFRKLVNQYFSPEIREIGWKGSGFNFYKDTDNHIINLFGIQGSWYGGSVCCETAIGFDFIPDGMGNTDSKKMSYASALIRKRLSPIGEGDYHWNFENTEEDNVKQVIGMRDAFLKYGMAFYDDFSLFPHPFDKIKPQDIEVGYNLLGKYMIYNTIELVWLLKNINVLLGRNDIVKDFCNLGMDLSLKHRDKMLKQFTYAGADKEVLAFFEICKNKFQL